MLFINENLDISILKYRPSIFVLYYSRKFDKSSIAVLTIKRST